jgi:hypothetical protein
MKDINIFINPLGPWPRHCRPGASTQDSRYIVCHANMCVKASYARKGSGPWAITRCKQIKSSDVPYVMTMVQPRLMKRVASILLASGRAWGPPPPPRLMLPCSQLYSSSRRWHVVPTTRFQIEPASPRAIPGAARKFPAWPQTSTHKVCHAMYCPTLHLNCSLDAGEAADAVPLTSQEFF